MVPPDRRPATMRANYREVRQLKHVLDIREDVRDTLIGNRNLPATVCDREINEGQRCLSGQTRCPLLR